MVVASSFSVLVASTFVTVTLPVDMTLTAVAWVVVEASTLVVAVINEVEVEVATTVLVPHGFAVSMQEQAVLMKAAADAMSFESKLA